MTSAHEQNTEVSRFDQLVELAAYQRDTHLPQNTDPYTHAYERSFADHLEKNQAFRQFFSELVDDMPDVLPSNIMRRTLKTFQHLEYAANPLEFPRNRATTKDWDKAMSRLLEDVDYRDQFFGNIYLPIMSNVSERGILLKAVTMLHAIQAPVRVLDMGCSLNDVLKRLALEGRPDLPELAYNPVSVMTRDGGGKPVLNTRLTARFGRFLERRPLQLGPSVGIDVIPFDRDKRLKARAVSDSRYMGELVMSKLTRQFQILADEEPEQVSFVNADAETVTEEDVGGDFDIAYTSTMLYQMPRESVKAILANAEAVTGPEGLIVVQDFVRRMSRSGLLQFYKHWPPYTYGVWVKDKSRPDLGFQKYFSAYSGRIENVIPRPALGRLPVAVALGLAPELKD